MGMLQSDKVIFYHPCNDKTEFTQTADWAETTPTYPAGKVSDALGGTAGTTPAYGSETEFDTSAPYTTTVKLAESSFLAGWVITGETAIRAKIGTVSGSSITFGAQATVHSGTNLTTQGGRWCALDSTHVVAVIRDTGVFKTRVLTISGTDITVGAEHTAAGNVQFPHVVALTSTTFAAVYRDGADSSHGTAKVGTVSGTDITFGPEKEFHPASEATELDSCALSSTKFVVVYSPSNDGPFHGTAKVGTVSGTDITFGSAKKYSGNGQTDSRCCAIDSTHFAVVYADGGNSWRCGTKIGTVSGTDITFGAEVLATTDGVSKPTAIPLSSTSYVVEYRHNGDSGHGTTKLATVSGADVTLGAESEYLSAGGASGQSGDGLSSSKFVVAYSDAADSNHGTAKVGSMAAAGSIENQSGLEDFGAESEFRSAEAQYISVAVLSATKFVVAYQDSADSNHGTARAGTVSGTDITWGAETDFLNANGAVYVSTAVLSATQFVVVYQDASVGSGTGASNVGTVSGTDVTFGSQHLFLSGSPGTNMVVAALSATAIVVAYVDGTDSSHGTAKVGTVSGTDITYGAEKEHRSAGATGETRLAVLSATKFVVAYRDTAVTGNAYAKVGTVAGTDITYGAESAAIRELPGSYNSLALVPLSATALVALSRDNTGSDGGAAVGTVSGTDVTFGSRTTFQSGTTGRLSASGISATQFFVSYENSSSKGAAKVGTVSGTSVAFGSETLFRDAVGGSALTSSPGTLSSTAFVVAYTDDADSNHGTAKVSTYGPDPYPTVVSETKVAFCGWFQKPSG